MKKTVALFLILFLVILKSGAQCFTLVYEGNGVDHMNFYFTGATVNGVNLQPGDEIGIFDGELCVGRATLTQVLTGGVLLPGVASADDNTTQEIDGYTVGHAITYRLCSGGSVITNVAATYSLGTGTFAVGATVQVSLAGTSECTNPPLLTLAETSGSTCGTAPVTVSGNTFGGSASSVTITENGAGSVSPGSSSASPFSFTYTPASGDVGRTVVITVTTDNPLGSPCAPASATYTLTVNAIPAAPVVGTITQPTCTVATGSVVLTGLPGTGEWTITRTPGGQTTTGSGTSATITGLQPGTYTFRVTDANGCESPSSANVVINAQPATPSAPVVGTITQPTCTVATGSVVLTGLPATGEWTITRTPGGHTTTGSGTSATITGLLPGTYTFTVTNVNGCESPSSGNVVINAQPATPTAPVIGAVTQPTCDVSTGSVGISGLPSSGTWILTRNPGGAQVSGTGTTFTVSGIPAGTYTYTVTGTSGCVSPASNTFTINSPPPVPAVPVVSVNCDGGVNHAIVTVTSPTGVGLEYRLNSGAWQESNVFNNVANGNNHRVTVRNTAGCTATTPEFSVNCGCVNPPLLTLAETTGSTCSTVPITVSGNTFGGSATSVTITENGAGSVSPGSSSASPFSFTYTPASGDEGRTVVITVTTDNPLGSPCAPASATYTLTVNTVPAAPSAITGSASICRPQADVTYSVPPVAGATSYNWNYTGQGVTIVGNTNTVTISFASNATSGTLTVQGVNSCGEGQASPGYNITVNPMPSQSPVTGNATPPCRSAGNVYSVTATAGSNYVWSVPQGSVITSGAGTSSITVTFGTIDGHVSVVETNQAGCTGTARSLFVTLQGCGLDADFTAEPRTLCAGSSVVFSNTSGGTSGNTTFAWNFGEGATPATAATAGPHTVSYSSGGSKTVSLTITDGASDTETKTGYITVNPLPAAAETITGTPSVCRGSSASYTVPAISGATSYSWVYSGQGADINGTTNTVTINFSSTATSGTLTVRGVNSCGNGTLSQGYAITVNPLPPAPGVGEITQPTCTVATGSVVLTGLPAGNWTINPGNRTGTGSTVTITGLTPDTYNFTVTNSNGCTSEESADIIINAQPAIPARPVIGAVTQPTCAISTGSVGISGLPSTGTWILTRNPGGAQVSGTGTTFTVSGIPAGTYTYTVTAASGCVSVASDPFTINSPLPVPDIPVVSVNCQGGVNRAIVTVTSPSGAGLEYRLNSGAWQESNVFNNVANGNHRVTVRNPAGCTATTPEFSVNCGCVNPPLLTLSETTGSTCGTAPVTISGNTFGGSATRVTITENGAGSVSPGSSTASPFIFTYTPASGDLGRTVVITVTTDNPLGSPCANATATYTLTVNTLPAAPVRGTVTHPTCVLPTGSVVLNSLPGTGEWTITRTPGGQTTTGSGTSATITGLQPGTYTFTVTDANGCVSPSSGNVVINAQPATPSAPDVGEITQPTCAQSTGSVVLSGLPATGSWTLTRSPGNLTIPGSGATYTVSNIPPGTFTFTVTNAAGCVSPPSDEVVIVQQPNIPVVPRIGNITHPTCELATGTVVLENLPENGEWILTRYPGGATLTGTGSSATISSLPAGVYNFAVTNAEQCTSPVSDNAVINAQPPIPNAPVVGTITHPTFQVATGSVVLSGLPSPGTWTLIRYPDQFTSQGTGTTRTVSGLLPGTYTFAVTNSYGCTSEQTGEVVINARPGAPRVIITSPPVICENETADLTDPAVTAGSDANLTFTYWTDAEATEAYPTPQAAPAGIYYIMGTSTAGYYTIRPVVVTADQLPVANAGPDTVLHYVFRTTLNAEIPAIGTGIWELVTGSGDIFDSAAPSTHVSGLSVGENVFSWTVTNGACDPVTDLMVVRVNNLTIPTLITPNEDGRNDYFEIRGLKETLGTTELTIFDRRGLKVYENNNYTNDEGNRWDGRDYNDNPLPEDTYFYVIRASNGVSISGYIVVRR